METAGYILKDIMFLVSRELVVLVVEYSRKQSVKMFVSETSEGEYWSPW